MQLRKIVCPVDFSEGSKEALRNACDLALQSGAALRLVHIWEVPLWLTSSQLPVSPDVVQQLVDLDQQNLDAALAEAKQAGVKNVTAELLRGVAWDEIVRLAKTDPQVDLIVMGTHGRTGLRHALIGSVAEKVVRYAPCRVLVTRVRGEQPEVVTR